MFRVGPVAFPTPTNSARKTIAYLITMGPPVLELMERHDRILAVLIVIESRDGVLDDGHGHFFRHRIARGSVISEGIHSQSPEVQKSLSTIARRTGVRFELLLL